MRPVGELRGFPVALRITRALKALPRVPFHYHPSDSAERNADPFTPEPGPGAVPEEQGPHPPAEGAYPAADQRPFPEVSAEGSRRTEVTKHARAPDRAFDGRNRCQPTLRARPDSRVVFGLSHRVRRERVLLPNAIRHPDSVSSLLNPNGRRPAGDRHAWSQKIRSLHTPS